jgi:hypothetical protein
VDYFSLENIVSYVLISLVSILAGAIVLLLVL